MEKMNVSRINALQGASNQNIPLSPFDHTELAALIKTWVLSGHDANKWIQLKDLSSIIILSTLDRSFIKKFNQRLHDKTRHELGEFLSSCTFDFNDDCLTEDRFNSHYGFQDCFTFNPNGQESISSPRVGLRMTVYKNSSEMILAADGTDAFLAAVHHPLTPPSIIGDGIFFEPGRSTTIRVRRHKKRRESFPTDPCRDEIEYSQEDCFRKCILEKCVMVTHGVQGLQSLFAKFQ